MAKTYQMNAFGRFGNTMSGLMIRLGVGPAGMHLLRTRGRKTGQPRTNPVYLVEYQGSRQLVAPYGEVGWVHNVRASGEADLLRGSKVERVRLTEETAEEAAPVLRAYLKQGKLIVGPYFDVTPSSPDEEFVTEAARHPVFRVTETSESLRFRHGRL
jgi:deazaflavin-dependent oxidoreductase (nitroreductase family)